MYNTKCFYSSKCPYLIFLNILKNTKPREKSPKIILQYIDLKRLNAKLSY